MSMYVDLRWIFMFLRKVVDGELYSQVLPFPQNISVPWRTVGAQCGKHPGYWSTAGDQV